MLKLLRSLKPWVPRAVLDLRTRYIVQRQRRRFGELSVRETFERIYAERAWGSEAGAFDSGEGSADAVTDSYVALVRAFIAEHRIGSVVDLGCGDFRVGRRLAAPGVLYTGVDIVRPLIDHHRAHYANDSTRFELKNLIEDDLPSGELALLRQVLQHLSNAEIMRVLDNCRRYRYLIVTEHLPTVAGAVANRDKPHGPDVRLYDKSGVFVDLPPFSQPARKLLDTPVTEGEVLRSVLIEHAAGPRMQA